MLYCCYHLIMFYEREESGAGICLTCDAEREPRAVAIEVESGQKMSC